MVEISGIEPLTFECKSNVFPLAPNPQKWEIKDDVITVVRKVGLHQNKIPICLTLESMRSASH